VVTHSYGRLTADWRTQVAAGLRDPAGSLGDADQRTALQPKNLQLSSDLSLGSVVAVISGMHRREWLNFRYWAGK
jgi:hypothetical protein